MSRGSVVVAGDILASLESHDSKVFIEGVVSRTRPKSVQGSQCFVFAGGGGDDGVGKDQSAAAQSVGGLVQGRDGYLRRVATLAVEVRGSAEKALRSERREQDSLRRNH